MNFNLVGSLATDPFSAINPTLFLDPRGLDQIQRPTRIGNNGRERSRRLSYHWPGLTWVCFAEKRVLMSISSCGFLILSLPDGWHLNGVVSVSLSCFCFNFRQTFTPFRYLPLPPSLRSLGPFPPQHLRSAAADGADLSLFPLSRPAANLLHSLPFQVPYPIQAQGPPLDRSA